MLRSKKKIKIQTRLALSLCLALSGIATTRGGQSSSVVDRGTPAFGRTEMPVIVAEATERTPVMLALADGR